MTSSSPSTKPHQEIEELVALLQARGMIVHDTNRAARKISQIGYYRLSGFWYPCRRPALIADRQYCQDPTTRLPIREDSFQNDVRFGDIIDLYIFDKNLRLLLLDAIERVEIHVRSTIAHEIGRLDSLAYKKDIYISPTKLKERRYGNGVVYTFWEEWQKKLTRSITQSRNEDCIKWHIRRGQELPFWVVVECWDYGLMSKYFANLKRNHQRAICERIGFSNARTFENWLAEINTICNKCAHHSRIWNYTGSNPLLLEGTEEIDYFQAINLTSRARKKIYAHIAILWFLVKKIGPGSTWIEKIAELIDSKPAIASCPYTAMGLPGNTGFPRELFGLPPRQ